MLKQCACYFPHQTYIRVIQVLQKAKLTLTAMADGSTSCLHPGPLFLLSVNSNFFLLSYFHCGRLRFQYYFSYNLWL